MDYLITYPTWGLTVHTIPDDEDRLIATRAVEFDACRSLEPSPEIAYRVHVPAVIPMHTPTEAIADSSIACKRLVTRRSDPRLGTAPITALR